MIMKIQAKIPTKQSVIRLKGLIVKEFYQIIRDPSSILISVILPAILLFLYGFGVSLDLNNLKIGLVMQDTAPDAQSFAKSMTDSRFFTVTMARDPRELTTDITAGFIRGMVIIPSYFSSFRNRQETQAPIMVIGDGSEPNTANFLQNYVNEAWGNWLQQEFISDDLKGLPFITTQPRYWFNEELESRNFLIPGSLAIIMALIGTLLTALVIAREWERGNMEALMSTPVTILEIIFAKLASYFTLGMVSMLICVAGSVVIYHVPLRGSLFGLTVATGCFLFSALGMGLMISTIAKNQLVASQVALIAAFLPSYMLSGFLFEIDTMPLPIQLISYLMTARYFVACLQTIFLVGNIWPLIFANILPMIAIGMVFFLITAHRVAKRLD